MRDLVIERDACISPCGKYCWTLSRQWKFTLKRDWLGFIMLNPSTADGLVDDPTIARCITFAGDLGFNGLAVRNLFAWRATDPEELLSAPDPIGIIDGEPVNDRAILDLCDICPVIIAAWGTNPAIRGRDRQVYQLFDDRSISLHCLGTTKHGFPRHPLYLPRCTKPSVFRMPGVPA